MLKHIVIFGGTFNPIHKAHLTIITHLLTMEDVDKVIVIPVYNPPHKNMDSIAPYHHRTTMVKIGIAEHKKVTLSNIEQELPQPSYTYQTIMKLAEIYPSTKISLALGEDSYKNIPHWKNPDKIIEMSHFIVFRREGTPLLNMISPNTTIINNILWEENSTRIREMIQQYYSHKTEKLDLLKYIPNTILDYILQNQLYL